ncbi:MAG TPA: M20/M25/M40 family metallo-hydrolase, partial [Synergistales bacterium]|nr:M20/M25/M40 family metallo-hydrolase [Synergistales bacterium]
FDPEEYTRRIGDMSISAEARSDLQSGDWLFGRGVADMKLGIAIEMCLLAEFSENPEGLGANILFLAVPDEENTSAGMRGAIPYLAAFQEEQGLDFLACINTEPTVTTSSVGAGGIFLGSIGKIMPFFFCLGRESHVGEYFEGLSASLIVSHLNILLEGNPSYADMLGNTLFPPQTCLKIKDLREAYSVTLPERAVAYYNYLTVSKTPSTVLKEMKEVAALAQERAFLHLKNSRNCYLEMGNDQLPPVLWTPRVMTVSDLYAAADKKFGQGFKDHYVRFISGLGEREDERDKGIRIVNFLLDVAEEKGPMVVTGFLPPFNPFRVNRRSSVKEVVLLDTAGELVRLARDEYEKEIVIAEVFEGITDLSYLGFQGEMDELEPLVENTPGWGTVYGLPVEDLVKLDIPVMNIGPVGRDAHKDTERVKLSYGLEVLPRLIAHAIRSISCS